MPIDFMEAVEHKLGNVVGKLSKRIEEKELEQKEFFDLVFELLKEEGLVSEYDPETVGMMTAKLEYKIGARLEFGVEHMYLTTKKTKISSSAMNDIQKYNELLSSVELYLVENTKDRTAERKKFESLIKKYVKKNVNVSYYRFYELIGTIEANMARKFKVIGPPKKIGQYDEKTIDEVLKKI